MYYMVTSIARTVLHYFALIYRTYFKELSWCKKRNTYEIILSLGGSTSIVVSSLCRGAPVF